MSNVAYMYLFVRADLSKPQQIIQVAHAVSNVMGSTAGTNAVLFEVKDEHALLMASEYLLENRVHHSVFYEPDISGYTAIATEPLTENREMLRKFKMMKENDMIK